MMIGVILFVSPSDTDRGRENGEAEGEGVCSSAGISKRENVAGEEGGEGHVPSISTSWESRRVRSGGRDQNAMWERGSRKRG